ncbi:MAG: GNAT family N-acetyltransferase [Cyclobacteriaceae bacterium]
MLTYQQEQNLSINEFRQLLIDSTLGERRPIDSDERLALMLNNANLTVTARENGKLVGVARSLSDFSFCTYMSDLAVHQAYQKLGIGKELIRFTKKLAPVPRLILLAAPKAIHYYPKIGMKQWEHCFYLDVPEDLK